MRAVNWGQLGKPAGAFQPPGQAMGWARNLKVNGGPLVDRLIFDPKFFLETLVEITDKERHTIPFIFNSSQNRYYQNRSKHDVILKPRQLGFCGHPSTKVLTADLEWITLREIKKGQQIIAVDEYPNRKGKGASRRMTTAVVEKKCSIFEMAYKLKMDDRRELIFTPEHKFLSKVKRWGVTWEKVKNLKIGDEIRYVTKPWESGDIEDGWFGGIIDGEGNIGYKNKKHSVVAGACQAEGFILDEMKKYVEKRGYNYRIDIDKKMRDTKTNGLYWTRTKHVCSLTIGRMDEVFRLIGQTRPKKAQGVRWWEGRELPGKGARGGGVGWSKIIGIDLLEKQEMIDLQTSAKTYIAEGFVSHNSTEIMGLFLHDTIYVPNTTSVIIAHTIDAASSLFDRVVNMFNSIPMEFRPNVRRSNRKELFFDKINSWYYIGSAEQKDFGRGRTINNLHCSEVAAQSWDRTFVDGLLEAVPKSGRVVMESTANGEGGLYYDYYYGAKNEENDYKAHYFRWFEHYEYREPLFEGENLEPYDFDEKGLIERFGVEPEQIKWRRMKKAQLRGKFVQEYPEWEDEDAFLRSGSNVFDSDMLKKRDRELVEQFPAEYWLGGELFLYKIVEPGARYIVGCDTSEGDINSDYSAAMVLRYKPLPVEQVALLHGRWTPDIFSEKTYKLARAYNMADIAVERNNHGHAMILNLCNGIVRKGVVAYPQYPHVYIGPDRKLGWHTTPLSKPQMVDELDRAIRSEEMVINSKLFIDEAKKFVSLKGGGMGVPENVGHDDVVIATAIATIAVATGGMSFSFV